MLHIAKEIYHDTEIEDKLFYVRCFESFIPHLTNSTINYFADNDDWKTQTVNLFTILDCKSFVLTTLLDSKNKPKAIELLKTKANSMNFYSFLAKYVSLHKDTAKNIDIDTRNILKTLPFFGFIHNTNSEDTDVVFDKFEGLVVEQSNDAFSFIERPWVNNSWMTFVSKDYSTEVLSYLKAFYGVKEFSLKFAIDTFIRPTYKTVSSGWSTREERVSPKYLVEINLANQDISSNIDFFRYCLANHESFGPKELCEYNLHVFNGENEGSYIDKSVNRFIDTGTFNVYSQKEWIEKEWLYKIDPIYLENLDSDTDKICKKLLRESFCVYEMTDSIACHLIIKNNLPSIIRKTTIPLLDDTKKEENAYMTEYQAQAGKVAMLNVDFITFINSKIDSFRDRETKSLPEKFKDLVLNDGTKNIKISSLTYFPDTDLEDVTNMSWFPAKITISIVNKNYGQLDLLTALGVKTYSFEDFYDEVICAYPKTICECINDFERNKDFHNFMISRASRIAPDKLVLLAKFPVYVIGKDLQEQNATNSTVTIPAVVKSSLSNHKILSSTVTELFEKKLVKASDLDIIHPDYKPDENFDAYWSKFGNVRFESSHFVEWLFNHKQTFTTTVSKTNENIAFWRWAKNNIAEHERVGELNFLPIIVLPLPSDVNGSEQTVQTQDTFKALTNTIYASNQYMVNEDIESFVKLHDANALFVSGKYLTNMDTPETIAKWMEFWKKVGVKNDYLSIIDKTIIKNITTLVSTKKSQSFFEIIEI